MLWVLMDSLVRGLCTRGLGEGIKMGMIYYEKNVII